MCQSCQGITTLYKNVDKGMFTLRVNMVSVKIL
jgi:hypothetical protein